MKVRKITTGYVVQEYDTAKKEWISQEFIAGDQVDWEDENGEYVDDVDSYLPMNMVQPDEINMVDMLKTRLEIKREGYGQWRKTMVDMLKTRLDQR